MWAALYSDSLEYVKDVQVQFVQNNPLNTYHQVLRKVLRDRQLPYP